MTTDDFGSGDANPADGGHWPDNGDPTLPLVGNDSLSSQEPGDPTVSFPTDPSLDSSESTTTPTMRALGSSAPVAMPASPAPIFQPPKKKRSVGKIVGVGIGVLGLLGGSAFAYTQITGGEKANTPEQAIESFYRSFETGDAIGMAKVLAPGERDIMLDSMVPMIGELSRLDILQKDLDLSKVPGYEAKVTNFKATSKILRTDLAEVRVTGGNLKTSFHPKKLPIGDFVRSLLGDQLDKVKPDSSNEALKVASENSPLVMQKVGKRWYLSLNYSVAEAARRTATDSYPVPAKGSGVAAKGADSAEAAVSEMLTAAGRFDVRRMIELLPPDEFAALHDYAGQFIRQAEDGVLEARKVAKVTITPKLRSTKISGDRTLVSIIDLPTTLKASYEGNVVDATYANKTLKGQLKSDTGEVIKADYSKECLTLVVDKETKKGCGQKGIAELVADLTGQDIDTSTLSGNGVNYGQSCVTKKPKPALGMVVVKRGGKWFVSPTRTMLDSLTAVMRTLDRKDLDCIKTQIEKSINSLQGTFLPSATDSTFDAPLPGDDPFAITDNTLGSGDTFDTLPVDDTFTFDTSSDTFTFDTSPSDSASADTFTFDTVPTNSTIK